jgi:hypothetical protein
MIMTMTTITRMTMTTITRMTTGISTDGPSGAC